MSDERLAQELFRFRHHNLSRRSVLASTAVGLAGASAGLLVGCGGGGAGDPEPANESGATPTSPGAAGTMGPEISSIRVPNTRAGCNAPFLYARELLLEEGFAEVRSIFTETAYVLIDNVAEGSIDIAYHFIPQILHAIADGVPIVMLGPAHTACAQIVAADYVADLADLRGRRLAVAPVLTPQPGDFAFAASVLQRIGISTPDDVAFVAVEGTDINTGLGSDFDAVFTYSPLSYSALESASASATGGERHVIFDSSVDVPWSQQLCCALFARRQFVEDNPVATRRTVRALMRALNRGASDPGAMAQTMLDASWVVRKDYANRTVAELTLDAWRTHDLADAMRFYGLLLHEAGLVKSTPEQLIQRGTDLTFFNELKEELAYAPGGVDSRFSFYCDPSESGAVTRAAGLATARRAT